MAAMIAASRRTSVAASKLVERLLLTPVRTIAASSPSTTATTRSFKTSTQMRDLDEDRSLEVDRRSGESGVSRRRGNEFFPSLMSDVFDPFFPQRSLSQVLNLMDQFMDNPLAAASRGMGGGLRRGWVAREENDGLYLRIDMPGLGKEDVKVTAEQNTLVIWGEGGKEPGSDEEGSGRRYSSRIDLPPQLYRTDQIRAEMKNGVLKVFVPKVKEEERSDVVQVKIE